MSLSPDTVSPRQEFSGSSPKRRRAEDKDEGIGSPDIWEDEKAEDLRREMIELRQQLDKERSVRMMLEEQVRAARGRILLVRAVRRAGSPSSGGTPGGHPSRPLWPPPPHARPWVPRLCRGHPTEGHSPRGWGPPPAGWAPR